MNDFWSGIDKTMVPFGCSNSNLGSSHRWLENSIEPIYVARGAQHWSPSHLSLP